MSFVDSLRKFYEKDYDINPHLVESEIRILDLVAMSKSNMEIAQILYISPLTVKTHLLHAYQKFCITGSTSAKRTKLAMVYSFWKDNRDKKLEENQFPHPNP